MDYKLSQSILDKILNDNDFSLRMCLHMKIRQQTLFKLVRAESDSLRLPEQVAFYKQEGFTEDEIFDVTKTKQ
ncbi:MAG TPA: hypothetical protein DCF99_06035 [Flavobacteriaceae bacterium]|nr:hypothetical protein [Flavobacteriaceae bacterium]